MNIVIKNAVIVDGTGREPFPGEIGIVGDKIAAIGKNLTGGRIIDARGRTVTPGFLDVHRHADLAVFRKDFGEIELRQGLTTVVNGNCGLSAVPFGPTHRAEILDYLLPVIGAAEPDLPTDTMAGYLSALERRPLPIHVGMLVGGGVLRADVAGYDDRELTDAEYASIHEALRRALADGALGVSLGLGYAPECFYSTDALIRALEPLRDTDVPLTVHMREEGTLVREAVEEMLTVAAALRCPLHLSHLKCIGVDNWGKIIPGVLDRLAEVRAAGRDVTWDVYPYTAGSTQLLHLMPPELLSGGTEEICRKLRDPVRRAWLKEKLASGEGFDDIAKLVGWDNIVLSTLNRPEDLRYTGLTVPQAAALRGQSPEDCVFDLLADEHCGITMVDYITGEDDLIRILRSDGASVISDSTYPTRGKPHPRLYGNFVRTIDTYVNQKHVLTLPEAVHKMTLAPAEALRLRTKGRIAPGMDADLLLFDPAALREEGTYLDPARHPTGIDTVLVGGKIALEEGELTGVCGGKVLRRGSRSAAR